MSEIDVEKKEIKRISDTSLKTMRNSSAYGLPNTPANSGMKAAQVKSKFYDFALSQNGVSLFTEINRIVAEINIVLAAYGINFETINTNFGDTNESITTHKNNVSNPHSVSAAQVGAYTKEEITNILNGKVKTLQDQLTTLDKTVSEMAGVDTGFSETITAMKNKLDNFFGETSDATDVIDTLNEIRNELAALDSASKKALYNLGAYDTISGNTITRKTGRFEINDNTCSFAYYDSYCVVVPLTDIKTSSNMLVKCNRLTSVYDSDVLNNIYKINSSDNNFAIIGPNMSMTSDSWKSFLRQAPLYIEYELSTSYEEEIIENQPLITLDSQGSKWLKDEWKKGLNLFDGVFVENYGVPLANLEVGKTYTFSTTTTGHAYKISVSAFAVDLVETYNAKITFVMTEDYKNCSIYTIQSGTTPIKSENIMLNEGSVAYSYQPFNANKHITNFEADFLKKESLKSANKYSGNITLPMNNQSRHTLVENLPSGTYTFNLNAINSNTNAQFILYANGENIGTYFVSEGATFTITETSTMTMYCNDSGSSAIKPMLNKGSEAQPYHEFEGEIVRSKQFDKHIENFDKIIARIDEDVEVVNTDIADIQARLDELGFKEGAFILASGSAVGNSIYKQGKYAIGNLLIQTATYVEVPEEFRPKNMVTVVVVTNDKTIPLYDDVFLDTDGKFYRQSPLTGEKGEFAFYSAYQIINLGWEIA